MPAPSGDTGVIIAQTISAVSAFVAANKALLLPFAASAVGAGFGAWFGARAILSQSEKDRAAEIQSSVNTAIAVMIALLGKLINFKKDLVFPAQGEAGTLAATLENAKGEKGKVSIKLELWPEIPFALRLPGDRLLEYAGKELDLIQLVKMLDYNLCELSHLVRQRNELIRQMNLHQAARGALPVDGLNLYIRYSSEIARNVDENLFFLDRGIEKARAAAMKLLPRRMHGGIAAIDLRPETEPLMPPRDLIRGWVK